MIVGILNVTPDSFSDGGAFSSVEAAADHALRLADEGADVIDVGGESTRPGAVPVDERVERERVLPVIESLARQRPSLPVSIDTTKAGVARAAIDAGARIVNDVSGLRFDPAIAGVCAEWGAGLIVMHSRGGPGEMAGYAHANYDRDVASIVAEELRVAVDAATDAGVERSQIVVDPGIGFAKRGDQSVAVLANLDRICTLGYPVLVGVSRKRVVGELTGRDRPVDRLAGTVGLHVAALARGARLFRVHDVLPHREALDAAWSALRPVANAREDRRA